MASHAATAAVIVALVAALPVLVAAKADAAPAGVAGSAPRITQLHLAVTPTAGEMVVAWATSAADAAANCSVVQYGTSSSSLDKSATGNATTYTLVTYHSPLLHRVTLSGLAPSTQHFYRAGCDADAGAWSDVASFTTPPSAAGGTVRLALMGDHGHTNNSVETVARMQAASPPYQALIHAGDISYANGWQPTWDSYMEMIAPLAQGLAWMVTPGNHEYVELPVVGVLPNLKAYDYRFAMPRPNAGAIGNAGVPTSLAHAPGVGADSTMDTDLYYSVDIGPVHVIALNSEVKTWAVNSSQYQWLVADLKAANANRAAVPWILAHWHRPWESSNHVHGNDTAMRDAWEPTLLQAGVDIVLNGHVHAFERSLPMAGGNLVPAGTHGIVYLTCGNGGNGEGLYTNWEEPAPPFSAHRASLYGHCALDVLNSTHAQFSMIRNSDGGVEDHAVIVRTSGSR